MRKNILLIENDPDIQYIIAFFLQEEGFVISCADQQHPANICDYQPDVVLLDDWTCGQSDHAFCTAPSLKSISPKPILIVLYDAPVKQKVLKMHPADGYIQKPFDLNEITGEISRLLSPPSPA